MWLTFLIASTLVNIVLLMYIRWLLRSVVIMSEDIQDVALLVKGYVAHVKALHEMEIFYGDQTLQTLLEHGKELTESLENIDFILNEEGEIDHEEEEKEEA